MEQWWGFFVFCFLKANEGVVGIFFVGVVMEQRGEE